ncbi:MAG TPA: hypothetical protein PLE54_12405 [Burkholderiaceae bacterium]|nr:hypothetical protein [Burkholderiaceae bacterium]
MNALRLTATLASVAALLAGCATTRMEAQWSNPEFGGAKLRDQTVLVACQARDFTVQAVCEDQIAGQLGTRGVKPVKFAVSNSGVAPTNEAIEAAAKKINARAVFRTTLSTSIPTVSAGPTIGIGVGGGGYRGGAAGGISMPIGGSTVSEAYAADTAIIETATGKLIWTGRATSPTGGDVTAQLSELTRVMFEALASSGPF